MPGQPNHHGYRMLPPVTIDHNIWELYDVLPLDQHRWFHEQVMRADFAWSWYPGTILPSDLERQNNCVVLQGTNPPQFAHWINLNEQADRDLVNPVLDRLSMFHAKDLKIMKVKFNLLARDQDLDHHYPHADIDDFEHQVYTAIYYLHDSDGDTWLFDQYAPKQADSVTLLRRCTAQANKLLIFDARRFHASSGFSWPSRRVVMNIVYMVMQRREGSA